MLLTLPALNALADCNGVRATGWLFWVAFLWYPLPPTQMHFCRPGVLRANYHWWKMRRPGCYLLSFHDDRRLCWRLSLAELLKAIHYGGVVTANHVGILTLRSFVRTMARSFNRAQQIPTSKFRTTSQRVRKHAR